MTHSLRNILLVLLTLIPSLCGINLACAQSASCAFDTIKVCDNTLGQNFSIVLKDLPTNYSQINLTYKISLRPNETIAAQSFVANLQDNKFDIALDNYTLESLSGGLEAGYADVTVSIVSLQLSNSEYDKLPITVTDAGTTTWRIFGTPVASDNLDDDDPHRLSLITPLSNCGYEATVKTDPYWRDISAWQWTTEDNSFAINANKDTAFISTPHYVNGELQTSAKTVRVKIIKTVGNTCSATLTRDITFTGSPEAILTREEWGVDDPVEICTNIDEGDDPDRYISGKIALNGHAPFAVTLSTSDQFSFDIAGENQLPYIHVTTPQVIKVADVYDRNGCHATNATIHGTITVNDRKPQPSIETDTITTQATQAEITIIPTADFHTFTWGVDQEFQDFASLWGNGSQATAYSTILAPADFYVIETNYDGPAPCPSDTVHFTVNFAMPLRYPNGISPNGDGHNDCLVIEGLPAQNHVTVIDSRGKKVFEADNYRNNWDAQGVNDGYYVYVFKGNGIKTTKETLAIKRSK